MNIATTDDPEFVKKFSYKQIRAGDGQNFPNQGDQVTVNYKGTFPKTGEQFDSSFDRGQPFKFDLGKGYVIRCWDQVVSRLSLGERGVVICPSDLAYGSRGAGGRIPPNTDIQFEIEMLGFRDKKYKAQEL